MTRDRVTAATVAVPFGRRCHSNDLLPGDPLLRVADSIVPQAAGAPIEWTVELSNGSILTETSNWTLQQ